MNEKPMLVRARLFFVFALCLLISPESRNKFIWKLYMPPVRNRELKKTPQTTGGTSSSPKLIGSFVYCSLTSLKLFSYEGHLKFRITLTIGPDEVSHALLRLHCPQMCAILHVQESRRRSAMLDMAHQILGR